LMQKSGANGPSDVDSGAYIVIYGPYPPPLIVRIVPDV
jgi:hypothetical protein